MAMITEVVHNKFTGEHAYLVSISGKTNDKVPRPYFESEIEPVPILHMLPTNELVDLHQAYESNRMKELIIGGMADPETRTILFVRGDGKNIIVPFSAFYSVPSGTQPDFDRLSFTDYGQTVCLGEYESSSDVILYNDDSDKTT